MAKQLNNVFTSYEFDSAQEETHAALLQPLNKMYIENELANLAEMRLNLAYDPNNTIEFVAKENYLKGQMAFATAILAAHQQATEMLASDKQD